MTDPSAGPPAFVIKPKAAPPLPYVPALGPVLRVLLWGIFAGVALLGASGAYLLAVTVLNRVDAGHIYTSPFTFVTLVGHTGLGIIGSVPFVLFGLWHLATARHRPNKTAIRIGLALFALGLVVIGSGVALIQLEGMPQLPSGFARSAVYLAHVIVPVVAVMAYVAHRKAGPRIKWKYGKVWAASVALFVAVMAGLHFVDPRTIGQEGPKEGMQYFFPSEMRTATGNFIPAEALMMDEYCMKCHQDVYDDHRHSAHKFSSFNNPAYLFSVNETRRVALERDGNVNASRWCSGCHDIFPFASGQFNNKDFDMAKDRTGHAGITCVVCHSITNINAPIGNGAFTIEQAQHYPWAFSTDPNLQWLNNQLIKAQPELHKKTFLKPLHKSAEFCSTCHKVHLPVELNHYKDFLRGQNHYDSYVLSGLGHGSRSFYFPPTGAKENCASCHMPLLSSQDFGSKNFDGSGERKRHSHFFPGGNTGLPELLKLEDKYKDRSANFDAWIKKEANYLKGTAEDGSDKKLRIDLFGLKQFAPDGTVKDESLAVLRPQLPALIPGQTYLIEVVVRTLTVGHHFSQGTVDSNEIWVDFHATANGKTIGRNGATANADDSGEVDPYSHFINVHMLDRHGKRIDRRNPQDIFTPLYDKQIPPGAGQVVHYRLTVPPDGSGTVQLTARLRYRKFDQTYLDYIYAKDRKQPVPKTLIVDMATDTVTLPVGTAMVPPQESPVKPGWQRWNDYGIGCLIEGGVGLKRGNLRQAEVAFAKLLTLGAPDAVWHGHANLARVYIEQGRLREAAEQLDKAKAADPPAPWWLLAWLTGQVAVQNNGGVADLDTAAAQFEKIVDPANRPRHPDGKIKYDFTRDYVVLAELGKTLYRRSQVEAPDSPEQRAFLTKAVDAYERVLAIDPEDLDTHYGLSQCYAGLTAGFDTVPPSATTPPDAERILRDVEMLCNVKKPPDERKQFAAELVQVVSAFNRQRPDPKTPKLPAIRAALKQLRVAYHAEKNDAVKAGMAAALAELHLASHAIYKPDELARARTTAAYRATHPAANAAAEAIVIYPTRPDHKSAAKPTDAGGGR